MMNEQEQYECFGIPLSVWQDSAVMVAQPPVEAPRRNPVQSEGAALLGVEALPSPSIATFG